MSKETVQKIWTAVNAIVTALLAAFGITSCSL